ncbi:MAG: dockerin type I domain-containing protein [Saprospiraceae bacterium]
MNRLVLSLFLVFNYVLVFGQTSQICGKVTDPTGNCLGFEGITVVITNENGDLLCETTTTVGGNYCCTIDNSDFPIKICPNVKCNTLNGLSTLDLVIISSFILGIPNPASGSNGIYPPDFRFIADVNGDGKITAHDLSILRKAILGILPLPNYCRIISKNCKIQYGNDQYNFELCLYGCEWINGPTAGTVDFDLYHIGDADNSAVDIDCTKPFQNDGEEDSFRLPNSLSMVYNLNSDNSISIGFETYQQLSFLNLSIEIGNLSLEDFIFPVSNAEYFIKDGILHIYYFSETKNQIVGVKDILIVKDFVPDFKCLVSKSVLINNRGDIYGIDINQTKTVQRNSLSNTTIYESSGNIILNLDDNLKIDDDTFINIYNVVGELVSHIQIHAKNIEKRIEVGNFNHPNGMYILNIQTSNGNILLSKKFVITK